MAHPPASDVRYFDSPLSLTEASAVAAIAIALMMLAPADLWAVPIAISVIVLLVATGRAMATWTRLHFDADGLVARRVTGDRSIRWDQVMACEYDFEEAKLRVYWQPDEGLPRWDDLLRGPTTVRDDVRQRAKKLDPLIRLPGPDRGQLLATFDAREAVDGIRDAYIDIAEEIGRHDLASEWRTAPLGDYQTILNEAHPGAGDRGRQLGHDRMFARLPAGSVPPARSHPNIKDALGTIGLGLTAVLALSGAIDDNANLILIAFLALVAALPFASPQSRRYIAGSGLVGGFVAGIVASIEGIEGALVGLIVVTVITVVGVLLYLAAHGEFDGW